MPQHFAGDSGQAAAQLHPRPDERVPDGSEEEDVVLQRLQAQGRRHRAVGGGRQGTRREAHRGGRKGRAGLCRHGDEGQLQDSYRRRYVCRS